MLDDVNEDVDDVDDDDSWLDDVDGDSSVAEEVASRSAKSLVDKAVKDKEAAEAAAIAAVKRTWGKEAARRYPLANLDGIGIEGVDEEAESKFLAAAKKSHEDVEKYLTERGYVRKDARPEGEAELDEEEMAAAAGWGRPVTSTDQVKDDEKLLKEVADAAPQGPMAVIHTMMNKGSLAEFALSRSRKR